MNEWNLLQISVVEPHSPAQDAGLRVNDIILKVNDRNMMDERFPILEEFKNESERGHLKLEVVDLTAFKLGLNEEKPKLRYHEIDSGKDRPPPKNAGKCTKSL